MTDPRLGDHSGANGDTMTYKINALKIRDDGLLERATIARVPGTTQYADSIGRILTDTGRTETVMGWGSMDGTVRVLRDEFGDDAYYIA